MQPRMLRYVLQVFVLLVLSNVAVNNAAQNKWHTCYFDEIHKNDKQILPRANTLPAKAMYSMERKHMRIGFSTQDFKNPEHYCTKQGERVKSVRDVLVYCQKDDVLSDWKKQQLMKIVRSAITMHRDRLKVYQVDVGFKVPELPGALCKKFTVPEEHRTTGVKSVDFVLYVASFPSDKKDMLAAGAPCAQLSNGRPAVGALTFTTSRIESTVYSVRVAAHEIAHALGFTYKMMKDHMGEHVQYSYLRDKGVQEVHSPTVKEFFKMQYNCHNSWGVELEDEKGVLSVPSRSHWERRNVLDEMMVGVVAAGYYTYLTLALFHDLGFYEADFTKAEPMDWGKMSGCGFLINKCTNNNHVSDLRYFCFFWDSVEYFCTPNRRAMGVCAESPQINSPEKKYQYYWMFRGFWYDYYAGEEKLLTDRCPIYEEEYSVSCTDSTYETSGAKGPDSWCLRKRSNQNADHIIGGKCAKVTINNSGDVYVQASQQQKPQKCESKDGRYYTATLQYDGETHTYECPTKEEVRRDKNLENLLKNASDQVVDYGVVQQ